MDSLYDLAPLQLRSHRVRRYLGDDQCVALAELAPADRDCIRDLYNLLEALFVAVRSRGSEMALHSVQTILAQSPIDNLLPRIHILGRASFGANPSPVLAKALHDVRGGGLTPLIGQLQLFKLRGDPAYLDPLFFLTRDHLKIMRNALVGLDDAKREEDLLPKIHSIDLIVEKWSGSRLRSGDREIGLEVECPHRVNISECCVEFGALDRILYNLINNACRHAATDTVRLSIFPVPDPTGNTVRFILQNEIGAADAEHLRTTDMGRLFETGISTTGSGYGLSVAADFVANAFGLPSPARAVEDQYLGARLVGTAFLAFFHWPVVAD
jgi:hypothetical protein